ncbi:MAG: ribonuclease P protein component [Planctomycetota bacterium]
MNYNFPRQARLLTQNDFRRVYRYGTKLLVPPLYVRARERPDNVVDDEPVGKRSRLGLSIGRRVGPAHVRNRWKRAIREAFRLHRHTLPGAYDLVVGVEWDAPPEDSGEVEKAFIQLTEKLRSSVES